MKLCCEQCVPVCDFCQHYAFNGQDGAYTGDGYCLLHLEQRDPEEMCDDFVCFNVEDGDETV